MYVSMHFMLQKKAYTLPPISHMASLNCRTWMEFTFSKNQFQQQPLIILWCWPRGLWLWKNEIFAKEYKYKWVPENCHEKLIRTLGFHLKYKSNINTPKSFHATETWIYIIYYYFTTQLSDPLNGRRSLLTLNFAALLIEHYIP